MQISVVPGNVMVASFPRWTLAGIQALIPTPRWLQSVMVRHLSGGFGTVASGDRNTGNGVSAGRGPTRLPCASSTAMYSSIASACS